MHFRRGLPFAAIAMMGLLAISSSSGVWASPIGNLGVAHGNQFLTASSSSTSNSSSWQTKVHNTLPSTGGCWEVNYPSTVWTSITCGSSGELEPAQIGGGSSSNPDYFADSTSYVIGSSTGSFYSESNFGSESDSSYGSNDYSLQMNSNYIYSCNTPATYYRTTTCWEQFVYDSFGSNAIPYSALGIEYWLLGYYSTYGGCPPPYLVSWSRSGNDCYATSPVTTLGAQSPSNLGSYSIYGGTVASGSYDDNMQFCNASSCWASSVPGPVVDLYNDWYSNEFNVLGVSNSQANFTPTAGNTFSIYDDVVLSSSSGTITPNCPSGATATAESNNMYLGGCSTGGNYIQYYEYT